MAVAVSPPTTILLRSIFNMGLPVTGKNIFPSNISGLPTHFHLRVSERGFLSPKKWSDIVLSMNKKTALEDLKLVKKNGLYIYDSSIQFSDSMEKPKSSVSVDFNSLAQEVTSSVQMKKLLKNMIYVGILCELLGVDEFSLKASVDHQFKSKGSVLQINQKAIARGRQYAQNELKHLSNFCRVEKRSLTKGQILIDGNTAAALGLVYGGCTFASWYPITPSSSLAENFESFCSQLRVGPRGEHHYAVLQAEDELAAIAMVAGAGWAGSRGATFTSGPGLSLMTETVGLMYFAEIPGVIWDIQRMGPSTGLPTRTSQGDVLAAVYCSHGDTRHPVFFPSCPKECFEFAHQAFDLSEKAQCPVFVLSDLDLGMNFWVSDFFESPQTPMDRGKILTQKDLENLNDFARYGDVDGDGIPYRTLPGTEHDGASYLTRGTGHTERAEYSEDGENYQDLMDRFDRKWKTIQKWVPKPEVHREKDSSMAMVYFGSTVGVMGELLDWLGENQGQKVSWLRIRAFPFTKDVEDFLNSYSEILVIEQNQQGQMAQLLKMSCPDSAHKIQSLGFCNGQPLCFEDVKEEIQKRRIV